MEDIGYNYRQKKRTHRPGPGQGALATQQLRGSSALCRQEPNAKRQTARNKYLWYNSNLPVQKRPHTKFLRGNETTELKILSANPITRSPICNCCW